MKSPAQYKAMMKKGDVQNATIGMAGQSLNNKGGKTLDKTKAHPARSKSGMSLRKGNPIQWGKGRQTKVYPQVAKGE